MPEAYTQLSLFATKLCRKCGAHFPAAPGRICPPCRQRDRQAYYAANRERRCRESREYYAAHRERIIAEQKVRQAARREEIHAYDKAYRARLRDERAAAFRAWRAANPAYAKEWWAANRHRRTAYRAVRRLRKRLAGPSFTGREWADLKARYGHRCLCCDRREPAIVLTADHVRPLSRGGAGTIDNIQPLCQSCNSRKGRRTIDYRPAENF